MVTYTLFLYLNVITFCFQSSLCRSMKGLEPLCASTTTASVQSLTIHFHCGHVICKNSLQGLLDVCIHCFHNRYPFLKINTWHFCHFLFLFVHERWSILLAHLHVVVYIYSLGNHSCHNCKNHYCRHHNLFPFFLLWSLHVRSPVLHYPYYNLTVFWCKGNAFFLNICHKDMTK